MTEPTPDRFLRKFHDRCCADVSRQSESEPCDKTAVAVVVDAEDGSWWPVCPWHANRYHAAAVSLTDLFGVGW